MKIINDLCIHTGNESSKLKSDGRHLLVLNLKQLGLTLPLVRYVAFAGTSLQCVLVKIQVGFFF